MDILKNILTEVGYRGNAIVENDVPRGAGIEPSSAGKAGNKYVARPF